MISGKDESWGYARGYETDGSKSERRTERGESTTMPGADEAERVRVKDSRRKLLMTDRDRDRRGLYPSRVPFHVHYRVEHYHSVVRDHWS